MSDAVLTALIVATGPTIVGVFNAFVSYKNSRKIEQVHLATNSMKDDLVNLTRKEAHAAGVLEQKGKQEKP